MALPHLRRLLPGLARHHRELLLGLLALVLTTALAVAGPWVLRHAIDDLALAVTRRADLRGEGATSIQPACAFPPRSSRIVRR